jgi:hypothetical protein
MDTLASQAYGSGQIEKVCAVARHHHLMLLVKLSIQRLHICTNARIQIGGDT